MKMSEPRRKKFSSSLPENLWKALKIFALDHDMEMYEVVQDAVQDYLRKKKAIISFRRYGKSSQNLS